MIKKDTLRFINIMGGFFIGFASMMILGIVAIDHFGGTLIPCLLVLGGVWGTSALQWGIRNS